MLNRLLIRETLSWWLFRLGFHTPHELSAVRRLYSRRGEVGVMVDVGAHFGESLLPFAHTGWQVLAFEPDSVNRKTLLERVHGVDSVTVSPAALGSEERLNVPFFGSDESSGISSLSAFSEGHRETSRVDVITLAHACQQYAVQSIDVLKTDAEGHDFFVLQGLDWDRYSPGVIVCEFEDRKTIPLGYTAVDMADFLVSKGYSVLVSEWHPIVRYGASHRWRRCVRYADSPPAADSWGNLLAFRRSTDAEMALSLLSRAS